MDQNLNILFSVFFHPERNLAISLTMVRISEGMLPEPLILVKYAYPSYF